MLSHQFFSDHHFRTTDRFSQINKMSEQEVNNLFNRITQHLSIFIQASNPPEILEQIGILYDLMNMCNGLSVPIALFNDENFFNKLISTFENYELCFPACKLIARILYFTEGLSVKMLPFFELLYNLMMRYANNNMVEIIFNALCNLSYDLMVFCCDNNEENDYIKYNQELSNLIPEIINASKNVPISKSFLTLLRHLSTYNTPNQPQFKALLSYLIDLSMGQYWNDDDLILIILWTLHDITVNYPLAVIQFMESYNNFIPFISAAVKEKEGKFAEPILALLYKIIENKLDPRIQNPEPLIPVDLPFLYALSSDGPPHIQFETLQFLSILTKFSPQYMLKNHIFNILMSLKDKDLPYKTRNQLLNIAVFLISSNDLSFLDEESLHQILLFIVDEANSDDENKVMCAIAGFASLKKTMEIVGKKEYFDQIMTETGAFDLIEQARDSTNEDMVKELEMYDLDLTGFVKNIEYTRQSYTYYAQFDDGEPITDEEKDYYDDSSLIDSLIHCDAEEEEEEKSNNPLPQIRFVYGSSK